MIKYICSCTFIFRRFDMSATVNKSVYKIRTKFKRQLEAAGLSADALDSVIFDSKKLEEWKMASALWKMSFQESMEEGLNVLGCTSVEKATGIFVPESLVKGFRNELRSAYSSNGHKNFLGSVNPEHEEYFKEFSKKMKDEVLSMGIYNRINRVIEDGAEAAARCNYLLHSSKENQFFGGLRTLHLQIFEASAFKDKVVDIAKLFEQMMNTLDWSDYMKDEPKGWHPLEGLGKMLEERGMEIPAQYEIPVAIPEQHANKGATPSVKAEFEITKESEKANKQETARRITATEVFEHLDVFREFVNVSEELARAGFGLEEVSDNLEGIRNIVKGCDALS